MANRLTRVIGGNGTQTQSFVLDPGLFQYVQSVLVEIDNTAGPDVQPTLTVETNNGVALADKQQGRSIPAGDTGRATWALRLDDEKRTIDRIFSSDGSILVFDPTGPATELSIAKEDHACVFMGAGQVIPNNLLPVTAAQFQTVQYDSGGMVNLGAHNERITIQKHGMYVCVGSVSWPPKADAAVRHVQVTASPANVFNGTQRHSNIPNDPIGALEAVMVAPLLAGDYVQMFVAQASGAPLTITSGGQLQVSRVGQSF